MSCGAKAERLCTASPRASEVRVAGTIVAVLLILGGQFWLSELRDMLGYPRRHGGRLVLRAASGQQVSFDGIQDYLDFRYERISGWPCRGGGSDPRAVPPAGHSVLKIGSVDLGGFAGNMGLAFALGAIAGISEKQLTVQVIDRARQAVARGAP